MRSVFNVATDAECAILLPGPVSISFQRVPSTPRGTPDPGPAPGAVAAAPELPQMQTKKWAPVAWRVSSVAVAHCCILGTDPPSGNMR